MAQDFAWRDGERVLFISDNTTDDPIGFMRLVPTMITARYPELRISYMPRNMGGNRIGDVVERLGRDILGNDPLPTWAIINLGLNDVAYEQPGTPPGRFRELYNELLERLLMQTDGNVTLACMTTTVLSEELDSPMSKALTAYNDAIREVAFNRGAQVYDIHPVIMDAINRGRSITPDLRFTTDGRHLDVYGNYLVTLAVLRYLNFGLPNVTFGGPGIKRQAA